MKRLWVDDEKPAPDGFTVATTYEQARELLITELFDELHLDYALDRCRTGVELLEDVGADCIPDVVVPISGNATGRRLIELTVAKMRPPKMDKSKCAGCYNDDYNHGLGGAKECWSLATAVVTLRRRVHRDEVPPWKAKPESLPNCYTQRDFIFVKPDREF